MFVVSNRNIILPGPDGQKFHMKRGYMGDVPAWAAKSAYFKALAADGKLVISRSRKDKDVQSAVGAGAVRRRGGMKPQFAGLRETAANVSRGRGRYTEDMFREDFPQFCRDGGACLIPPAMLEEFISTANAAITPDKWVDGWRYAAGLYVAHQAAMYLRTYAPGSSDAAQAAATGALVGVVKSAALGDSSVTYDTDALTKATDGWGDLNATQYGQILATRGAAGGYGRDVRAVNFRDWYTDRLTVRRVKNIPDGALTKQERVEVLRDVPCRVYRPGAHAPRMQPTAAYSEGEDKLQCDNAVDIRAGDELLVRRGGGLGKDQPSVRAIAGEPVHYYEPFGAVVPGLAHQELALLQKEYLDAEVKDDDAG